MLKKGLAVGLAGLLLLGLFFGRDAFSYVATTGNWMKESVRENVPIEFEIKRARNMIDNLDGPIRGNMRLIAIEEAEVARLKRELEQTEEKLVQSQEQLMRLNNDLQTDTAHFEYGGRVFTASQVEADLSRRFERHRTMEATADKLRGILQARQKGLEAARDKLEGMLAAKRQLEVDVENLEARSKMVQVAQTNSNFNFDDSHLARTRDLVTQINTRIDVAEKMVHAEGYFHDQIPLDDPHQSNISEQITEYFNGRARISDELADTRR